jgi:hypothetical protein
MRQLSRRLFKNAHALQSVATAGDAWRLPRDVNCSQSDTNGLHLICVASNCSLVFGGQIMRHSPFSEFALYSFEVLHSVLPTSTAAQLKLSRHFRTSSY